MCIRDRTIIDRPLIEGKIEHLGPIMNAFYIYSNLLIKNEIPLYESKLIDIKAENCETIIKSLLILSFCISNQGYQKLKNFLYDF